MFTKKKKKRLLQIPTLGLGDLVFLFLRHGPTTNTGWTGTPCIDQASLKRLPLPPKCWD